MPRTITPSTSLETLRKEAKRWLKQLRAQDPEARASLDRVYPAASATPVLRDIQHALALEYGFESWIALRKAVDLSSEPVPRAWGALSIAGYEQLAQDFVLTHDAHDLDALQRLNAHYKRSFTVDDVGAEIWRRVYSYRQRRRRVPTNSLEIDEARTLVAQDAGFGSWAALTAAVSSGRRPVPPYAIDPVANRIAPRRRLTDAEWDELIAVMKERRITSLDAGGLMTDAVLVRIAALEHVTALNLAGSRELTDEGLQRLASMPQLRELDLSEYPGGKLTDRGLEVLEHLRDLRRFEMTWQGGISDTGVAHLRSCDRLEQVNLMGTPTGDGAIDALQGKPALRRFSTGRMVTDEGLRLLHHFPRLTTWQPSPSSLDPRADRDRAVSLLVDGPFTNRGLASLAGLDGVFELDLFWHVTGVTTDGFAHLKDLPNLTSLGADGRLSDNTAMRHFAALPSLRLLRAQGTVATDEGFEALSQSTSLEGFWGRECPHLGNRGFLALSKMPSLRQLGVSCKHVDDIALAALPHFPALRELTPIDVNDQGFVHVGRCEGLERLTCMYCRDTTDTATKHIARLQIRVLLAGLTQITDRSLELLGRMPSLEQVELYECRLVSDAGLPYLAALPNLREVHLDGLPGVTLEGTSVFPPYVRVMYTT